jgi:hypothetical protein
VSLAPICSLTRRYAFLLFLYWKGYAGGSNDDTQWSGADYVDNLMKTVTGGVSSTAAMGKGVTEAQFTKGKL